MSISIVTKSFIIIWR